MAVPRHIITKQKMKADTNKTIAVRTANTGANGRGFQYETAYMINLAGVQAVVGLFDLQGGKPGCAFCRGTVSPTITRGRASVSDIHALVMEVE